MARKIGYIIGSIAKASINRRLAQALVRLAPEGLAFTEIPIKDLPLYTYEYEPDFPPVGQAYKRALAEAEALLFITPEYNRGVPGALKNAIDWGSRPKKQNGFARKPSAVIGCSEGKLSTALAQRELHSTMGAVASPQMVSPEAYITYRAGLIDDADEVTDESVKAFLVKFLGAFQKFLDRQLG